MAGRQCHKLLWWMVHEPAAPELQWDDLGSAVMDQGARVGELARTYVPGGVLIDLPYNAFAERLAATERALLQRSPAIYEAAFRADNVFVSVDILERRGLRPLPRRGQVDDRSQGTPPGGRRHPDSRPAPERARRARMEVMHLNRGLHVPRSRRTSSSART